MIQDDLQAKVCETQPEKMQKLNKFCLQTEDIQLMVMSEMFRSKHCLTVTLFFFWPRSNDSQGKKVVRHNRQKWKIK